MKVYGERVTVAQLVTAWFMTVRRAHAIGREQRALAGLGAPALVEELADHLAGWVTKAVQDATGTRTDLSGARDLGDVVQRFQTAVTLLDTSLPGQTVACIRDGAVNAARCYASTDPVVRGSGRRTLASAVWLARAARGKFGQEATA